MAFMLKQTLAFKKENHIGKLEEIKTDVENSCKKNNIPLPKVLDEDNILHFEFKKGSEQDQVFNDLKPKYL